MAKTKVSSNSFSTEEKIKAAAQKIFLQKGFSATRTRDIAAESGINLALLNYYFRSKQKLFDEVIKEKIQTLLKTIIPILQDSSTNLDDKIKKIVFNYIKVLTENNDLPIFVLNELRKTNSTILSNLPKKAILQTSFIQQLKHRKKNVDPIHFLLSLLGLIIFPFLMKPVLKQTGMINEKQFYLLVRERELLIPIWMEAILKNNTRQT